MSDCPCSTETWSAQQHPILRNNRDPSVGFSGATIPVVLEDLTGLELFRAPIGALAQRRAGVELQRRRRCVKLLFVQGLETMPTCTAPGVKAEARLKKAGGKNRQLISSATISTASNINLQHSDLSYILGTRH